METGGKIGGAIEHCECPTAPKRTLGGKPMSTPASHRNRFCVICGSPVYRQLWRAKTCSDECRRLMALRRVGTPEQRLIRQTRKTPTCWVWTGRRQTNGYGVISVKGKPVPAHRLSYTLYRGPIPEGMFVCHHCDTPLCVNPAHLFIGTHLDNVQDMMRKGRHVPRKNVHGERNPSAKLTDAQVIAIIDDPRPDIHIAKDYGVSNVAIGLIKRGEKWKHLPRPNGVRKSLKRPGVML